MDYKIVTTTRFECGQCASALKAELGCNNTILVSPCEHCFSKKFKDHFLDEILDKIKGTAEQQVRAR